METICNLGYLPRGTDKWQQRRNNGRGNWGVAHVASAYGKREQLQDNLSGGGGNASRCLKAQRVAAAFPAGPTSRCRAIVGSDNVVFIIPKRRKPAGLQVSLGNGLFGCVAFHSIS